MIRMWVCVGTSYVVWADTFRADETTPYHNPAFSKAKTVILYCASGGRAALAGKALQELGYAKVFNLGGFKDWVAAGGAVER